MLANHFPELQNTSQYQELQKDFTRRFALAALYVKKGDIQKAKEIIGEFGRIEEKQISIALLLQHKERFLEFIRYSVYGDVIQAYKIAQEDPRYQKLSLYQQIIQQIEKTLNRIDEAINLLEFSIEPLLEEMKIYPKAKKLLKKLHETKILYDLYRFSSLEEYYNFLENCNYCKNTSLAQQLQLQWYKIVQKGEVLANNGDINAVFELLFPYLHVKSKQKQIDMLLKKSIRQKIKKQIQQNEFSKAEKNIYKYLELFSKDSLFEEIMQKFEKTSGITLALTLQYKQDKQQWTEMLQQYITS